MKHVIPTLAASVLLLVAVPGDAQAGSDAAVMGVVRDTHGSPLLGTLIELLGPDTKVVATAVTDDHGRYFLSSILPGRYRLRASAAYLLPTLRGNLDLRGGSRSVADLTMTAIFEAGSWLPTERRAPTAASDDWRWTLRSTANRPLLRLADDPSVMNASNGVSSSTDHEHGAVSRGNVSFVSGDGTFGEGGNRQVITLGHSSSDGETSVLKADLGDNAPGTSASLIVGAGLEHDRFWGGGTRLFVGVASHPELETGSSVGSQTLHTAATERIALGDVVLVDAGTLFTAEHLLGSRFDSSPYLRVAFRPSPELSVEYHLATSRALQASGDLDEVSVQDQTLVDSSGKPLIVKGLHQELAVLRGDEKQKVSLALYRDQSQVRELQGGGMLTQASLGGVPAIFDPTTETFRLAVRGDSAMGAHLAWVKELTPALSACLDAELGDVLETDGTALNLTNAGGHMRTSLAAALSAKVQLNSRRTGTVLQTEYRWQPRHTLTQVDEYDTNPEDAYLGVHFRQRIWAGHQLKGLTAVAEAANLLSQGYEPLVSSDGQTFFLAQVPRTFQGGLSFSF